MPFTPANQIVKTKTPVFTSASDVIIANQQKAQPTTKLRQSFMQQLTKPQMTEEETMVQGGGEVGKAVANIAIGGTKGLTDTLQTVAKPITSVMEDVSGQELGFSKEELEAKNTAQKVGKTAEQIGEFILPATKIGGLMKGVGTLAKIGGQVASDVGVATAQEGDVKDTVTASVAFSSLPFVGSLLGKYSKVGKSASDLAENLEKTSLRLTPVQKLQLEKSGDDIVKWITEKKITGSPEKRYEKISSMYEDMEETVQNLIKSSGVKYGKEQFKSIIKDLPQKYATEFDNPEVYNQLVKLSDELVKYADNFTGDIPLEKINDIKRAYFKNAFNKLGDQVTNEARLTIGEALYKDILENIPQLKPINMEYAKTILAKKLIGKALGRNELGLIGNLISMGTGGTVGTAVGGPIGAGIGTAVGPTIATKVAGTETRSMVGASLQNLAEFMKTVTPDKAGNLVIPKSLLQGLISEENQSVQE